MLIPKNDLDFLQEKGYVHELNQAPNEVQLILRNWAFPPTYTPRIADLLIRFPAGYPLTPLDMFWTSPVVMLANGAWPQASQCMEVYAGRNWQRWSRHFVWRAGVDNLRTFITAVVTELNKGI